MELIAMTEGFTLHFDFESRKFSIYDDQQQEVTKEHYKSGYPKAPEGKRWKWVAGARKRIEEGSKKKELIAV